MNTFDFASFLRDPLSPAALRRDFSVTVDHTAPSGLQHNADAPILPSQDPRLNVPVTRGAGVATAPVLSAEAAARVAAKRRAGAAELLALLKKTDPADADYEPLVRAVRSKSHGYVYRVRSLTSRRMVQLQSRGEFHLFHLLAMAGFFRNLREGFGVPQTLTEAIAEEFGIKHPYNRFAGENAQMSVDFIGSLTGSGWVALDYKPARLARRKRVQQKFRIVRAALADVGVPHLVVTEADLPPVIVSNLELLYTFVLQVDRQPLPAATLERAGQALQPLLGTGDTTIYDAAVSCEPQFGCGTGRLVRAALWMVAMRHWRADLTRPVHPDAPLFFKN